jgi:hypothetical protein
MSAPSQDVLLDSNAYFRLDAGPIARIAPDIQGVRLFHASRVFRGS